MKNGLYFSKQKLAVLDYFLVYIFKLYKGLWSPRTVAWQKLEINTEYSWITWAVYVGQSTWENVPVVRVCARTLTQQS